MDDSPWFPPVFLGVMRIGAIPVPVNPLYPAAAAVTRPTATRWRTCGQAIGLFLEEVDPDVRRPV